MDAFVPEAVFPQLVRCDVAAAGQSGQGADVPGVQGRNVLLGYGLRLLSYPVPRPSPAGAERRGRECRACPSGQTVKHSRRTAARACLFQAKPQNRRAACPSVMRPANGVAGGGDTQGRADARSEAPAPAPHSPRRVAAFGGKRLGRGSLRLRLYCLGALRGLPRGTDRRDSVGTNAGGWIRFPDMQSVKKRFAKAAFSGGAQKKKANGHDARGASCSRAGDEQRRRRWLSVYYRAGLGSFL